MWVRIPIRRDVPDTTLLYHRVDSDLWQVGGFLQVLQFPPPIKQTGTFYWAWIVSSCMLTILIIYLLGVNWTLRLTFVPCLNGHGIVPWGQFETVTLCNVAALLPERKTNLSTECSRYRLFYIIEIFIFGEYYTDNRFKFVMTFTDLHHKYDVRFVSTSSCL